MENLKKPPQESVTPVVQQEKQEELMHDVLFVGKPHPSRRDNGETDS
ncbi:hypothetical protein RintRC_7586 [Richelia intracellularis]|nr:hypothetical protein RintRC_7586 [Richelia intracellularis]